MVTWKRDAGMLAWSMAVGDNPVASIADKQLAAQFLVAYGASEEADRALAAMRRAMQASGGGSPAAVRVMERLASVNTRFRRQHLGAASHRLGDLGKALLDAKREAVLVPAKGSRTLLVVFSTMYSDFWLSYPVLHCLLPTDTTSILYLKDPREMIYLRGLVTYGSTFRHLCAGVRRTAEELSIDDIRVMAFSSGGYPALLLATLVGASAYLGFSIRTDLSPTSPFPNHRYVERGFMKEAFDEMMFDLKPVLAEREAPKLGILYHGSEMEIDALHAKHLADLPNFMVKEVPATRHNTILSLLAQDKFEAIVRRFLR
jgi:hypothetical protein